MLCNAVFGKTMENVRKRVNIELITKAKIAKKRFASPNFKMAKRFHENLIAVEMHKRKLLFNRPIQVGFVILDLSKLHMFNFHSNVGIPQFPDSKLLCTRGGGAAQILGELKW